MTGLFDIDTTEIAIGDIPAALAQLAALQSALIARLLATKSAATAPEALLTVEEAARKLSVTEDWLYRRGKNLGLAVTLGAGTLRFSALAIDAYIRAQAVRSVPTRQK